MHFNFLVGNHYLTQGMHYCKNFLRSVTQGISENKNKLFSMIRVVKNILWEEFLKSFK